MNTYQLQVLLEELKALIATNNMGEAIKELKNALPSHSEKYNVLIQLSEQFHKLKLQEIQNTLNPDLLQIRQSALTANLLTLIDILDEKDFAYLNEESNPKGKFGSVLYAIPSKMEVQAERLCTVRLAFDRSILLEDFTNGEDTHIRSLRRIDERIEVELVDPNSDRAFEIRTISSAIQKVEKDDYTEWLFFLKPLKEGRFPLFLKVSIITIEEGEKIRKELVLQEEIEVVTQLMEEVSMGLPLRHSGFVFTLGLPTIMEPLGQEEAPVSTEEAMVQQSLWKGISQFVTSKVAIIAASVAIITTASIGLLQNTELFNSSSPLDAAAAGISDAPPYAKLVVNRPFHSIQQDAEELIIEDPSQPALLKLRSGAQLKVPANSFIDSDGGLAAGPVKIRFQEFHEAKEIISSGIPMKVRQEDGGEEWMQTAGMFKIEGYQDNEPVALAEGKTIEVEFRSRVDGDYDFWFFDEGQGNWINKGPSGAPQKEELPPEIMEEQQKELEKLTPRPPVQPKATPEQDKLLFQDLDLRQCPELAGDKPPVLTYAGEDQKLDPRNNKWIAKPGLWRKKELKPTNKPGIYQLTLIGDSLYSIPVKTALAGKNLAQAQAEYQKLLADYQAKLELVKNKQALFQQQAAFRRTVRIQSFGIHNYDVLWKKPDAVPLLADFDFKGYPEEIKEVVMVYLITGDNRTVVGLSQQDWRYFRFSPSSDNKILAVLPEGRVALFTQSDFREELENMKKAKGKEYVFQMRIENREVKSKEDLEDLIELASS